MEGPLGSSGSGGGCHVRRATPALDITAFPGDSGEWPMGHWWSQSPWEYQWRVGWSLARQGGAAMWGEPLRLLTSQPSLGTLETDQWAIDNHDIVVNSNGGSVAPWHVRGGCHVRRATLALDITDFPGDSGEWPMGHWWSQLPWEYQWRVGWFLARQEGAAMWGEPLRLLTSQPSLGTLKTDQWAIDNHDIVVNSNGGSVAPWHVRGGLPCEESHSGSWHHSLPWGLWRLTNGPLMITVPLEISMEGRLIPSTWGGGCHVKRATPALDITAFPGDCGD